MPDILAIHWDKRRLRVVEASIGSSVRVNQSFTLDIPETLKTTWLRDALRQKGTTARQAIVCLAREEAILRQLELPDVPDDELPSMVYFQASTRSTTPLDQLVVDYLPLPRRAGTVQRDVLLATAPRSTVDPIRAALGDAGVELLSLSVTSFCLAELVLRAESALGLTRPHSRLVVYADANRLEVVLLGKNEPIAAHMVRPPLDEQGRPVIAKSAADVSRVLVPAQPWLTNNPIESIWIVGDSPEWQGLDDALRERWNCPVERFDSQVSGKIRELELSKLSDSIAQFGPVLGLALTRLQPRSPVLDLLHPRQPKPKQDPRKLQLAAGSAAALVVIALFTSYYQLSLASLEASISQTRDEVTKLSGQLKVDEPKRNAALMIGEWKTHDVDQLKQFVELHEVMQGTGRLYLADYDFGQITGDAIAKLHATGNARERTDWQQLAQRLVDTRSYQVKPSELTQQSRDPDYPNRFALDANLVSPGKPAPATAPASPTTRKDK